jgi:hypothetical protein
MLRDGAEAIVRGSDLLLAADGLAGGCSPDLVTNMCHLLTNVSAVASNQSLKGGNAACEISRLF